MQMDKQAILLAYSKIYLLDFNVFVRLHVLKLHICSNCDVTKAIQSDKYLHSLQVQINIPSKIQKERGKRHDLFLCEAVLVVQCKATFANCHQSHCGIWVSSDFQTKQPARLIECTRSGWFQLQLKEGGRVHLWSLKQLLKLCIFVYMCVDQFACLSCSSTLLHQCCVSHQADTGVFDIHPNRV